MKQNIYDDPDFFAGYHDLRKRKAGLNEVLEQPAMNLLFPNVQGMNVLDLGCGEGGLCRKLRADGASSVTGVDISANMLRCAKKHPCDGITYVRSPMEEFSADDASFDLVVSSLAFHYVADFEKLVKNISRFLRPGGYLVFSMEHPPCTAAQGIHPYWSINENGEKDHWILDRYHYEGIRKSRWFVDGVIKYHRKIETVINTLIDAGMNICRVLEPHATEEAEKERPSLLEERRRPPFLLVKARKEIK